MKKVLVTALAVGVCVGVSSTSSADWLGSETHHAVIGSVAGSGGNSLTTTTTPFITYASESWSATNAYTIPTWNLSFGVEGLGTTTEVAASTNKYTLNGVAVPRYELEDDIVVTIKFSDNVKFEGSANLAHVFVGPYSRTGATNPSKTYKVTTEPAAGTFNPQIEVDNVRGGTAIDVNNTTTLTNFNFTDFHINLEELRSNAGSEGGGHEVEGDELKGKTSSIPNGFQVTISKDALNKFFNTKEGTFPAEYWVRSLNPDDEGNVDLGVLIDLSDVIFYDPDGFLSSENQSVTAEVTITSAVSQSGTVTVAQTASALSQQAKIVEGQTSVVDRDSLLSEFKEGESVCKTTADRACQGMLTLANVRSGYYTQDGKVEFANLVLNTKVTVTLTNGGDFPETIDTIWLDTNNDGTMQAGEELVIDGDKATGSFVLDNKLRGKTFPIYVDVDTEPTTDPVTGVSTPAFLPYRLDFTASVAVTDADGNEFTHATKSNDAGSWRFNGTVFQIPRFDIKGGTKCTATLVNTSDAAVSYITTFYPAQKGIGETPTYGDNAAGILLPKSTMNVPCNKFVKKIKGNQGTLEFVIMEDATHINGSYQSKGANERMTQVY